MGMGYSGNFAMVIEMAKIEEMNLDSFNKFIKTLEKHGVSLEGYADATSRQDIIFDDDGGEIEDCEAMDEDYESFQTEFKAKTGIGINISYHSSEDNGSRYDGVDGAFFELEFSDVFQVTPEAKKLKEEVGYEMEFFVHYG